MDVKVYLPWKLIGEFMVQAFKRVGVPEEDARICAQKTGLPLKEITLMAENIALKNIS